MDVHVQAPHRLHKGKDNSSDCTHPPSNRCVLEKFPRSQHRPSFITAAKLMAPVPSEPVKRWNFCKVDWNHYSLLTNEATQNLTSSSTANVEEAYQDFCSALSKQPKGPSHVVAKTTTYCVGIRSVAVFISPSWMPPTGKNLAVLPQHYCPILTSEGVNDRMKPSIPLTSHTPAA